MSEMPNHPIPEEQEPDYEEEDNEEFVKETEEFFDKTIWKSVKEDIKELSKRELARQMFVSGAVMCKAVMEREMEESIEGIKKHPEKIKEMMKMQGGEMEDDGDGFWDEGSFTETMSSEEAKGKMRTFHMKHDEEMNYSCKNCNAKMSAHNKDWHSGMCDSCFDKGHFPESNKDKQQALSEHIEERS